MNLKELMDEWNEVRVNKWDVKFKKKKIHKKALQNQEVSETSTIERNASFVEMVLELFRNSISGKERKSVPASKVIKSFATEAPTPETKMEKQSPAQISRGMKEFSWKRIPISSTEKPTPRRYSTAINFGGRFYNFGGLGAKNKPNNEFWTFDFGVFFKLFLVNSI